MANEASAPSAPVQSASQAASQTASQSVAAPSQAPQSSGTPAQPVQQTQQPAAGQTRNAPTDAKQQSAPPTGNAPQEPEVSINVTPDVLAALRASIYPQQQASAPVVTQQNQQHAQQQSPAQSQQAKADAPKPVGYEPLPEIDAGAFAEAFGMSKEEAAPIAKAFKAQTDAANQRMQAMYDRMEEFGKKSQRLDAVFQMVEQANATKALVTAHGILDQVASELGLSSVLATRATANEQVAAKRDAILHGFARALEQGHSEQTAMKLAVLASDEKWMQQAFVPKAPTTQAPPTKLQITETVPPGGNAGTQGASALSSREMIARRVASQMQARVG